MSTPEGNAKTVNRYLELAAQSRVDEIVELYAQDGTVEDPVGGEVHIGREAIRGFYKGLPAGDNAAEVVTLRALGHEVAFYWKLTVDLGESKICIDIISVMTFNDDGRIATMKAYWSPENITPV